MGIGLERWVVALTGASGVRYGVRLLEQVAQAGIEVHALLSDAALRVLRDEEDLRISRAALSSDLLGRSYPNVEFHNPKDIGASIASGSFQCRGMVIAPCSMNTLGAIASGLGGSLIHRAADVALKEGRRLILVPRETPLSEIHLRNMLTLSRMGARIVPAMPGFYSAPQSVADIVDLMVMKIMDQMNLPSQLVERWSGSGQRSDNARNALSNEAVGVRN